MLVIVVLGISFYYLLSSGEDQRKFQEVNRYKIISDTFLTREFQDKKSPEVKKLYKNFSLSPIAEDSVRQEIEDSGETIFSGRSIYGKVRVFKTPEHYYIYIQRYDYDLMLKDNRSGDYTYRFLLTIGGVLLLLLLFMYLMVLRKLYPLKKLHKQIDRFAGGDLNVEIDTSELGDDEIGKIARSFDKAIRHIRQLISSKNLFMRNIMHELKTPITKGRIVVETIDDDMARKVLVNAFDRMNELISDLAEIERITMYTFEPDKKDTTLSTVIARTEEVLMAERERYEVNIVDTPLHTDEQLLALVLKNLLDNGIKYSPNRFVRISSVGRKLEVRSEGEPLKEKLSYYTEPFSQEEKRNHGFGLGLYIVANVLEKLGYGFGYRYDSKNGENVFEVVIH
jgi:two-component system OmpR family sensor kinase